MYYEIYRQRNLIYRGKEMIGGISFSNELMYIPSTVVTLPIYLREYLDGHNEMKIFVNDKVFWGVINKTVEDKQNEVIEVYLDHIVYEWTYRQISVNNAIKDKSINVVFKGSEVEKYGHLSVSANDFTVYVPELKLMTLAAFIERAGASAWATNGDYIPIVTYDSTEVKLLPDEYPFRFLTDDGSSVEVKVNVKNLPGAKTRKNNEVTVVANAFEIAYGEDLSADEYIQRAYAFAYDEDGDERVINEVISGAVGSAPGDYEITFVSGLTELTVDVTRLEEGEEVEDVFPFIKPWIIDPSVIDEMSDIFADMNMAYPGWRMNYEHGVENRIIDYVYSRQNKLDALTKTVELTQDIFWRVRFVNERVIDVSMFGDEKDLILSKKPTGPKNIRLITDPVITNEYEHVVNMATVYSEKSDTGMSSLTLREVYNDPSLQIEGFPVVIMRANVNNERDYSMYVEQYPKLAPNNELEYAVLDEESIALEGGILIEGTFAFNDIAPFRPEENGETKEITDDDRVKAAVAVYEASVKKLKYLRRKYEIEFTCEELPAWLAPGDKVRLLYDNAILILDDCSNYQKKILSYSDDFVITRIEYNIDATGAETDTIRLEKYIRVDREVVEI